MILEGERKRKFNRVCVFCGSRAGYKPMFADAALELGKVLVMCSMILNGYLVTTLSSFIDLCYGFCSLQAERKINLVYGGGSIGLMGLISKAVYEGGCHVLGYDMIYLS